MLSDLLSAPLSRYRALVRQLESDPLFQSLRRAGVIRKVSGRLPEASYQEYMDERLVSFAGQYQLEDKDPGWVREFCRSDTEAHISYLVRKYATPASETRRMVRFLRYADGEGVARRSLDKREAQPRELGAGPGDDGSAVERIAAFVQTHNLSVEDFRRLLLEGDRSAESTAAELGVPPVEIEEVLALLVVLESLEGGPASRAAADRFGRQDSPEDGPAAYVSYDEAERKIRVKLSPALGVGHAYRVDQRMLKSFADRDAQSTGHILDALRWLSEAGGVLGQMISLVAERQSHFLMSGDRADLLPITQTQVADSMGISRSTVCRAVRNRLISTPWGEAQFKELLPSVGEVVKELSARHPEYTAQQLASLLSERCGTVRSARTIAHHRQRGRGSTRRTN